MESPYCQLDVKKKKSNNYQRRIKEEGIYIFGGLFENSEASDQLRILKIGQKPLFWTFPETNGIPPIGRFQHGQSFLQDLNILVVYGGRNDKIIREGIMGDFNVLNLENLQWIKIQMNGLQIQKRCSFSLCVVDSQILVFGGYEENGFSNADLQKGLDELFILNQKSDLFLLENKHNEDKYGKEEEKI
ncbi:kelch motif family protein, putative [Ichthyophthirius multifiliis]|uniref:Kelch motif family protein, putative n=1 Tax=Ichthyophthirius multifiliis TaxID=5932 RepID=G0QWN7_ICHMU|nr:kelch motif family protein, putative [Ichthyophthirius multifiliis]EGR30372.1 kelch motif family protein, putative [Ichthyophthirius multifiliis]|eukprot:XP_004031959.1 kelch motif family protein, putative [Ichthyophthirius multifiliis]